MEKQKRYIQTDRFVPIDLLEPLQGRESRKEYKTVLTLVGVGIIWFIISFISHRFIRDILETGFIVTSLLQLAIGLLFAYLVISKFVFKVDNTRKERVLAGKGNKAISLGHIWGINPGGVATKEIDGEKHITVRYTGKEAIVLKLLKKSVLVSSEDMDRSHYASLQKLEDIILKSGYKLVKINTRYNPDNDKIWDELDSNLAASSKVFGKEYTSMMSDMLNYHYEYTKVNSNITVMYYFIIPTVASSKRSVNKLVPELYNIIQSSRLTLESVSWKELYKTFRDYYGVNYLDLDEIFSNMSSSQDLEVKTLAYVDESGNLFRLKPLPKPTITNEFTRMGTPTKINKHVISENEETGEKIIDIYKEKVL